jgi:hypothetical protein
MCVESGFCAVVRALFGDVSDVLFVLGAVGRRRGLVGRPFAFLGETPGSTRPPSPFFTSET